MSFLLSLGYNRRIKPVPTIWLDEEEKGNYDFDYLRCGGRLPLLSANSIIGLEIAFERLSIEIGYFRSFTTLRCLRGLTLIDELDSLQLLVCYHFYKF